MILRSKFSKESLMFYNANLITLLKKGSFSPLVAPKVILSAVFPLNSSVWHKDVSFAGSQPFSGEKNIFSFL